MRWPRQLLAPARLLRGRAALVAGGAVLGRRDAGPAPERARECALPREAEQERELGDGLRRVVDIAQREIAARLVDEALVREIGFGELALQRAPAHVERAGDLLFLRLARGEPLQQRRARPRLDVRPVDLGEL